MNKYIDIPCSCRHSILHLERDEDDGTLYLMIYEHMFGSKQMTAFYLIQERLKNAWKALRGKNYYLFDIMIRPDESEEFIQKIIDGLNEMK